MAERRPRDPWTNRSGRIRRVVLAAVVLVSSALVTQQQDATGAERHLVVANPSEMRRAEVVRAPVPFARGALRDPDRVTIDGSRLPVLPLLRWHDGSVALLQAHVPVALDAGEVRRLAVGLDGADAPARELESEWFFEEELPFLLEVSDPWGQVYSAALRFSGDEERLSSPLVRVRRYTAVPTRDGREFLGIVAWMTTFAGERRAEMTLVVDNGAHRSDAPALGPVRLRGVALVSTDRRIRFRPRFARENALKAPAALAEGGYRQHLLGPSDQIYLGDRTAKAFRLDVFVDGEEVDADERRRAAEAATRPILAWPELAWLRRTEAFGAYGGPAPAGLDQSRVERASWIAGARYGPFGGHGDAENAAAQGTPRNGSSALHNAVRWQSTSLLRIAETQVLQHCLRPTPGFDVREPRDMAPFRVGLSERARTAPHRFTACDYEHFSADLVYDYYWLTGDPLALAELRRLGSGLMRVVEGVPFRTSRGEGWCLQAGVLIACATGNAELLEALRRRARELAAEIEGPPAMAAIAQPPHPQAFGTTDRFDAPWQMAALVRGLTAVHRATGDTEVAAAAVRVASIMAGPGWLEDVGPKYLVSAKRPDRYSMPVGFGPMEGTALMQVDAFVLAAELANDDAPRLLFERRAHAIVTENKKTKRPATNESRWLQVYLDRRGRRVQ